MSRRSAGKRTLTGWMASLSVVVALAFMVTPGQAAQVRYDLDVEHTSVGFKVRHFFSKVPGRFDTFSGVLMIDEENLANSSLKVEIEAASINTNEEARDRHLRSDAFFDVENHATITFVSTAVRTQGEGNLVMDGNLTIRGITKKVSLDVEVLGFGELYNRRRGAFEASTTINRKDFNVSWNDFVEGGGAVLGEDVEILLNVEAKKAMD
jgi:polyisoprenoid-binding protein YceI